jgi:hypothetical protein
MKLIILISSLLLLNTLITEAQTATCSAALSPAAVQVLNPALITLLQGNTVCAGNIGNWQAQEYHKAPSDTMDNLIDYHQGTNTSDPTSPIGSWSISIPNNTVNYTYHEGSNYTNTLYNNGDGTYTFCDQFSNTATKAIAIKIGQVAC